jgi:flagellum-specific peptidoglycan hydrolase FlgJ
MTNPRLAPYIPYAIDTHAKFYPRGPFVSIILAQGILESDWFRSTSGHNNFFGIKATPAQIAAGHSTVRWTHETWNGQYVKVQQHFADYATPGDCFDAHAHLLTTPWYQRCIDAPNPQSYAHALWLCHYATGIPGHPYDQALINLMAANDLYQYDQKGPVT